MNSIGNKRIPSTSQGAIERIQKMKNSKREHASGISVELGDHHVVTTNDTLLSHN